jgi:ribose transport system substrate-binding protein
MKRSLAAPLLAVLASITVLAACSSTSSSSSGAGTDAGHSSATGGTAAAQAAAAKKRVAPYLAQPTTIGITRKLTKKPPAGKKAYMIAGPEGALAGAKTQFVQAAAALGWTGKVITFDITNPLAPGQAIQQAITGGASYIAVYSVAAAQMTQGLAAAKAAHVPVIEVYNSDPVQGAANGIYASVAAGQKPFWNILPDFIIGGSGAKAHVLLVNVPDVIVLKTVAAIASAQFASQCSACTVKTLNISASDLGNGSVPSEVVSALQADPSINYALFTFGDLAGGVPQALQSAGLKAKIVGGSPDLAQIQSLDSGTSAAWAEFGDPESAWRAVDAMARLSVGDPVDESQANEQPFVIFTPHSAPRPAALWNGPSGFQNQYRALWHVG